MKRLHTPLVFGSEMSRRANPAWVIDCTDLSDLVGRLNKPLVHLDETDPMRLALNVIASTASDLRMLSACMQDVDIVDAHQAVHSAAHRLKAAQNILEEVLLSGAEEQATQAEEAKRMALPANDNKPPKAAGSRKRRPA